MSVFDGNQTVTTEPGTTEPNQGTFVDQLVQAKGDQWSDPEVLAKGKLESDTHIQNLENQLKELRDDLGKQDYAKDLLDKLQGQANTPGTQVSTEPNNPTGTTEGNTIPDVSDLESLIEQTLSVREQKNTAKQNIDHTDNHLNELFGTEATAEVTKRAKDIGMSMDKLQEIASESPSAFFKLIGEDSFKREVNQVPSNTVNTESGFNRSAEKDWAYYQNLRRTNPKQYYDPKTQNQMVQDKQRLGGKFGN